MNCQLPNGQYIGVTWKFVYSNQNQFGRLGAYLPAITTCSLLQGSNIPNTLPVPSFVIAYSIGSSIGHSSGNATGASSGILQAIGTISGNSSATGNSGILQAIGTAIGNSSTSGISIATIQSIGSAIGNSNAIGSIGVELAIGTAIGISSTVGSAAILKQVIGSAIGNSSATGNSNSGISQATGTANGSSSAVLPFSPLIGSPLFFATGDLSQLFQNSNGTTPAVSNGDRVEYFGDLSVNANNATQSTSGSAMSLATGGSGINGLNVLKQTNSSGGLFLASSISFPGAGFWSTTGFRTQSSTWLVGGGTGDTGCFIGWAGNTFYFINDLNGIVSLASDPATGNLSVSVRRDSSNNVYLTYNGISETLVGNLSGTLTLTTLISARAINDSAVGSLFGEFLYLGYDPTSTGSGFITAYDSWLNTRWGFEP